MTKKEFKEVLLNFISDNKLEKVLEKIEIYKKLLLLNNKKMNLTRLDSEDKIYGEYFYNSISPYLNISFNDNDTLLDIGSGSGIPGILIAIFFPNIKITIIESNLKKCNFMNLVINHLSITNIRLLNERIEIFSSKKENIEDFNFVTSRAFSHLKILIEVSFPILKIGGKLIAPKSNKYLDELNESKWILEQLNIKKYESYKVDSYHINIFVVIFIKECKSNSLFPRAWKEIIS